jgi:hypothetical protein
MLQQHEESLASFQIMLEDRFDGIALHAILHDWNSIFASTTSQVKVGRFLIF